jgi:hypothetical protein
MHLSTFNTTHITRFFSTLATDNKRRYVAEGNTFNFLFGSRKVGFYPRTTPGNKPEAFIQKGKRFFSFHKRLNRMIPNHSPVQWVPVEVPRE